MLHPLDGIRLVLAPMAGVTDLAFRTVCREKGAAFTYTEMVSSKGLLFNDAKSRKLLQIGVDEHPCAAQIFGSDPDSMGKAAAMAAEISGADCIDINMGCPTSKIISSGDGCALMRNLDLAARILSSVVQSSPVPVTVKFRKAGTRVPSTVWNSPQWRSARGLPPSASTVAHVPSSIQATQTGMRSAM